MASSEMSLSKKALIVLIVVIALVAGAATVVAAINDPCGYRCQDRSTPLGH